MHHSLRITLVRRRAQGTALGSAPSSRRLTSGLPGKAKLVPLGRRTGDSLVGRPRAGGRTLATPVLPLMGTSLRVVAGRAGSLPRRQLVTCADRGNDQDPGACFSLAQVLHLDPQARQVS